MPADLSAYLPAAPTLSTARNRLWLPRLSLSACIRGAMLRDTRGLGLSDTQRLNYFPAAPLCSLSWWFTGVSALVHDFDQPFGARCTMPGRFTFAGPHTVPTLSWNDGPVHGMMVLLMPDALYSLIGLQAERWVDRLVNAEEVLPPDWLAMCEAVQQAPDDDTRLRMFEDFLDPLWQAARPAQNLAGQRYGDWAQGLALRAATSSAGRSLRQVERRIKQWAGQSMRELRGVARSEQAFFETVAGPESPNWADVAAQGGYADQSHFCRETRRITGFTPAELHRRILEEEGFWAYRLWGMSALDVVGAGRDEPA